MIQSAFAFTERNIIRLGEIVKRGTNGDGSNGAQDDKMLNLMSLEPSPLTLPAHFSVLPVYIIRSI